MVQYNSTNNIKSHHRYSSSSSSLSTSSISSLSSGNIFQSYSTQGVREEKQRKLSELRESVRMRKETSIPFVNLAQDTHSTNSFVAGSPNRPIVIPDSVEGQECDDDDDDKLYDFHSEADHSGLRAPQPLGCDQSYVSGDVGGHRGSNSNSNSKKDGNDCDDDSLMILVSRRLALKEKLREKEAQFERLRYSMEQRRKRPLSIVTTTTTEQQPVVTVIPEVYDGNQDESDDYYYCYCSYNNNNDSSSNNIYVDDEAEIRRQERFERIKRLRIMAAQKRQDVVRYRTRFAAMEAF